MPLIVAEYGAIVVMAKYVEQKKTGGVFYFRRRVPYDVKRAYPNLNKRGEIYFSLKTKNPKEAAQKAHRIASEQDGLWRSIRNGDIDEGPEVIDAALALLAAYGLEPGQQAEWDKYEIDPQRFYDTIYASAGVKGPEDMDANWLERVSPVLRKAIDLFADATTPIYLSQALKEYQELKGEDPTVKPGRTRAAVISEFISLHGDLPIEQYSRTHANQFRDHLLKKGNKTTTVQRRLNDIRPVFKTISREHEIEDRGIFESVQIAKLGSDSTKRSPFSTEELRQIQTKCLETDDDIRWIIALLSDTGMRVSEAIGLRVQDVEIKDSTPHINLVPHETRRLKNSSSARLVPLVGAALWAVTRALPEAENGFLFPRYIEFAQSPPAHKGTHASNTFAQWLKKQPISDIDNKSSHSFRHTVQDRLRDAHLPNEVRDAICGWSQGGMGSKYGQGFTIELLAKRPFFRRRRWQRLE